MAASTMGIADQPTINVDDHSDRVTSNLYETDFYTWTQQQAALLREGRVASADLPNIVEELETLGRSELSALVSAYKLIALHLLKLLHQPDKASARWDVTIKRERGRIEDLLEDTPGLRPKRDEAFAKGYARGRRDAAIETGLEIARFPKDPPFTREQAESSAAPRATQRPTAARRRGAETKKPPRA